MWLVFEIVAFGLALGVAFARPRLGARWFRLAGRAFSWVARHRALAVTLVILAAFVNCSLMMMIRPPVAQVHDEFSYLLAADTFAHGRLTNPTPEPWEHFESFHIILRPTYQSKYPPGQGLALAAGQFLSGNAIVGAWVSTALACGAVCWMLQAWLPPRWALLGGLFASFHMNILMWWGWTYWGGSVAMLGGALLFGGLRRVVTRPHWAASVWLGLGLAVLANSRPYEGLVASLAAGVVLLGSLIGRSRPCLWIAVSQVLLPMTLVLLVTGAAMAYYNYRITQNPLHWPYLVYQKTHLGDSAFLWAPQAPFSTSRFAPMRASDPAGIVQTVPAPNAIRDIVVWAPGKLLAQSWFYLQALMVLPLLALPWKWRNRWMRFALLTCAFLFLSILPTYNASPHYSAPITGLVIALLMQSLRHVRLFQYHGQPVGRFLIRAIPLIWVMTWLLVSHDSRAAQPAAPWVLQRERVLADLKARGGRHLVIVHYGPKHNVLCEWVYNAADIHGAQIVWARELGADRNAKLKASFKGREVWVLDADADPPTLRRVGRADGADGITCARDP
jgi:hypothetical protein